MTLRFLKTPEAEIGAVVAGNVALFIDPVGNTPKLKFSDGTVQPLLNTDGTPIVLPAQDPNAVPDFYRVHGKDYAGVTELAATSPLGQTVRLTQGAAVTGGVSDFVPNQKFEDALAFTPLQAIVRPTGLFVTPPLNLAGFYLVHFHGVTADDSLSDVGFINGDIVLAFDNGGGTPDTRVQAATALLGFSGLVIGASLVIAPDIFGAGSFFAVDSAGEVYINWVSSSANPAWIKYVMSISTAYTLTGP